jgi:hypothetical protein
MSSREHADENLWLRHIPPADLTAEYVEVPGGDEPLFA